MAGHAIEIILSRQLADCLSVPVFIVDPQGTLLFYNAPAEVILGQKFQDTGAMPVGEWGTNFFPHDGEGNQIPPSELPLVTDHQRPRTGAQDILDQKPFGQINQDIGDLHPHYRKIKGIFRGDGHFLGQ